MRRRKTTIENQHFQNATFVHFHAAANIRNPDLFAKWRNVGLRQVFVGMESFSDSHLQAMNKGLTLEQQEQAVDVLRELGILLYASFVVNPDFTREDFRSLTAYVRRLKLHHASFSILTPLPGTVMYEERQSDLLPYRPEMFDFIHTVVPTRLPFKEFYSEFARLWQCAIPLHRALKTFSFYGLKRLPGVFRLLNKATSTMRNAYLDHV